MQTYGVGFYGFGFIGKVHAYGYLNLPIYYNPAPVKAKLVGVCTSSRQTAEASRDLLGFDFGTTDYRELLNRDDIQIVHCCAPNNLHHDFVADAMRAGKHIYCDKPLALNADEARDLLNIAERTGYRGKFQMTFQYRFFPATMRAKQLIDEGFLGRVFGFRAEYLHAGYIDPTRPMTWRLDAAQSGCGALGDLGSHALDLIYGLLGPYAKVNASLETMIKERPLKDGSGKAKVGVDDVAILNMKMPDGAVGTIEAWRLATGAEDELRFEIHGERGALRFNLMDPNWLEAYDAREAEKPLGGERGWKRIACVHRFDPPGGFPGPKNTIGWMRGHVHCLYNFLDAITKDENPRPSLRDGAYIQQVMDSAIRSSQDGCWVDIPGV
ncbi:MAG TPA: Gfo/Idh/MocA family oxidoreductase [Candidatus Brocadiia bacterium]|nr:Gfo/Idh/MocA family oxidoreductase [Candidatus Brocadiia bacterium]